MGEGFKRLKRLYLMDAILKAFLVFAGAALLVVATFLIVIDRSADSSGFTFYYALIGIGVGLLLGLGTFFIFFKGERSLARKLDKQLGLNEKVQTMHAFRNDDGEITELQRADTQLILDGNPVKKSKLVKGWLIFGLAVALALTYFVVSLVLYLSYEPEASDPSDDSQVENPPDEKPDEEPFEPTEHHKKELEQLIKYVRESALNEDAKAMLVDELTILLGKLDSFETENSVKEYVVGVIKRVRDAVNSVNTTYLFHSAKDYLGSSQLKELSQALYLLDLNSIQTEITSIYNGLLYHEVDGALEMKPKEALEDVKDEIVSLKNSLQKALEESGLTSEHKLYAAIEELNRVLTEIVDKSKSVVNAASRLDPALNGTFFDSIKQIVPPEKVNDEVKVYTVNELMRIFGILPTDLDDKDSGENDTDVEDPNEEPPEEGTDGGFGTGGNNFPSKDKVIDPESTEIDIEKIQVEYGDIIGRYSAEIMNKIEKGEISEELAKILMEYFKVLTTPKE